MPLTPAQKQAAYRARLKAARAPTPDQETALDGAEVQLTRAAGVPRNYPLSVWKRIAQHFIQGEGRLTGKVRAIKTLVAGDAAMRKTVKDWVKLDQSEASRRYVAAQGWTINDGTASKSVTVRMADAIEAAMARGEVSGPGDPKLTVEFYIQNGISREDLEAPFTPDPVHADLWEKYQRYLATGSIHGAGPTMLCQWCGGPSCRVINGHYYCNIHDGIPAFRPAAAPTGSPAEYINSDFGKGPIHPVQPQGCGNGRPMFGPVGSPDKDDK